MAQLNFFTPYLEAQQKSRKGLSRLTGLLVVIVLIFGGIAGFNFYQIYHINAEIQTLESTLNTPEMQAKGQEMDQTRRQLDIGQKYYQELQGVDGKMQQGDIINVDLIDNMVSTLPAGLVFKELEVTIDNLNITGSSATRKGVAELEYNLKKTGIFHQVHVNSIARPDQGGASFTFVLNGTFR